MQNSGTVIRADYVEHVPPDPGAGLNWLANRQPEKWRKAPDGEIGSGTLTIEVVHYANSPQPRPTLERKEAPTLERLRKPQVEGTRRG